MLSMSFWRPAVVALALASPVAAQDGLRWEDNLDAARRLAAQSNRLVLLHFTAPTCTPCQQLEQQVFSKPGFGRELVGNFVAVKINVDVDGPTALQYGVRTIPADAIVTPRGELVELVSSPRTGPEFVSMMNRIAAAALAPPRDPSRGDATTVAATPAQQMTPRGPIAASSGREPTDPRFAPAAAPAQGGITPDDRYAEYYNRRRAEDAARTAAPYVEKNAPPYMADAYSGRPRDAAGIGAGTANSAPPPQQERYAVQPPVSAPIGPQDRFAAQPPVAAPAGPTERYAVQQPAAPPRNVPQLPPGCAPLGLEGYCPVSLCEKPDSWTMGDTRWGVQHEGRTYLFAGPEQQRRFLANPYRYAPVLSGNDPVMALDQGQSVAGSRTHGGFYGGRIYLFSSEASYQQFSQNPNRYAAAILQAELSSSKR